MLARLPEPRVLADCNITSRDILREIDFRGFCGLPYWKT